MSAQQCPFTEEIRVRLERAGYVFNGLGASFFV